MITDNHNSIFNLACRYRRLPMDLADVTLVLLDEHIGTGRILTTDQRDFSGWQTCYCTGLTSSSGC